jgi:hypothetical protein
MGRMAFVELEFLYPHVHPLQVAHVQLLLWVGILLLVGFWDFSLVIVAQSVNY